MISSQKSILNFFIILGKCKDSLCVTWMQLVQSEEKQNIIINESYLLKYVFWLIVLYSFLTPAVNAFDWLNLLARFPSLLPSAGASLNQLNSK